MQFIVRLEKLIAAQHISHFHNFLRQCSLNAEMTDNRYMMYDIQAIQASVLCAESLSGEQLHLFLAWSSETICLQRIIQHAATAKIPSGFSYEQIYDIACNLLLLPRIVQAPENMDIVIYHSTR